MLCKERDQAAPKHTLNLNVSMLTRFISEELRSHCRRGGFNGFKFAKHWATTIKSLL